MSNTIDRLNRARVQLGSTNPFFSYLSYYLKFHPMENKAEGEPGIAVSDTGDIFFDDEYVSGLTDAQIIGVICHEVLHLSFSHLVRRNYRDKDRWDTASDICANAVLNQNNFSLPHGSLVPDKNDSLVVNDISINDCSKKSAEQLFEDLLDPGKQPPPGNDKKDEGDEEDKDGEAPGEGKPDGGGEGGTSGEGSGRFDKHIESESRYQQKRELENDWKQRLAEAFVNAKQQGSLPAGMERLFNKLCKEEIDWRRLLNRYLQRMIPVDYSWARPNKKGLANGYYLPDIVREKIDVCIVIDASGSISNDDITDIVSEVNGMVRAYQHAINLRIITHDVDVHVDKKLLPVDLLRLSQLEIKGGGGTSHFPVMKHLNKNHTNCDIAIFFTDGFSDIEEIDFKKNRFNSIFVVSRYGQLRDMESMRSIPIVQMKGGTKK